MRPNVLSALAQLGHAYFKFVVADAADEHEALGLVDELSLPRGRVLFMPEARSASELRERSGWVAERALASGVRYSGRLHLELYGGRRGT